MLSILVSASLAALTACLLNILVPWVKNIQRAKASGLRYVIVPWYFYNRITSLVLSRTLLNICARYIGQPSPVSWRTLVTGNWPWKHRHLPFAMLGTDTFLTVAPGGIIMHVADADVTSQIIARQADFPKASRLYKSISIYGENLVAAEGATWRHHRRLMSSVFGESNNQLVWKQSLHDGQMMLTGWLNKQGQTIKTMAQDTMLLSLSIIGRAGLGQTIQWPTASSCSEQRSTGGDDMPANHQMTFTIALTSLLQNIYYIVVLPQWLLGIFPVHTAARQAHQAYLEWGQYLREIISSKRESIQHSRDIGASESKDLLSQLLSEHEQTQTLHNPKSQQTLLSETEILGNLFVLLLAGHETSANSIHFCLALLAMHPMIQAEVQADLDRIFQGASPEVWNYERHLPQLMSSKLNAVLSEQLRLFAPTITIPKYLPASQKLRVNGKDALIPAKTLIRICVPSIHRNPSCWRPASLSCSKNDDDLETFNPNRWFTPTGSWYTPQKGAYIPFSDGPRACLGRRFAQVEVLAVLALILSKHSFELAVGGDDHINASQEGRDQNETNEDELRRLWWHSRRTAERTMREKMAMNITLQLAKGSCVPVQIVARGKERFVKIA